MKLSSKTLEIESTEFGIQGELILENVEDFFKSGFTISHILKDTNSIDIDQTIMQLEGTYLTGLKIDFSRPISLALAKKAIYNDDADDTTKLLILKAILVLFLQQSELAAEYRLWRNTPRTKHAKHTTLCTIRDLLK